MSYQCRTCGTEVPPDEAKRLPFSASCDRCRSDLHVCHQCVFWDRLAYNECREPQAERVLEKDRANRCEYFRYREGGAAATGPGDEAKAKADALFGGSGSAAPAKSAKDALDDLFKK